MNSKEKKQDVWPFISKTSIQAVVQKFKVTGQMDLILTAKMFVKQIPSGKNTGSSHQGHLLQHSSNGQI